MGHVYSSAVWWHWESSCCRTWWSYNTSQLASNCSNESWKPTETHHLQKHRDQILRPPNGISSTPLLHLEILSINTVNRICDKGRVQPSMEINPTYVQNAVQALAPVDWDQTACTSGSSMPNTWSTTHRSTWGTYMYCRLVRQNSHAPSKTPKRV